MSNPHLTGSSPVVSTPAPRVERGPDLKVVREIRARVRYQALSCGSSPVDTCSPSLQVPVTLCQREAGDQETVSQSGRCLSLHLAAVEVEEGQLHGDRHCLLLLVTSLFWAAELGTFQTSVFVISKFLHSRYQVAHSSEHTESLKWSWFYRTAEVVILGTGH